MEGATAAVNRTCLQIQLYRLESDPLELHAGRGSIGRAIATLY